jgi:HAD superfamily hydrolase (TIGR01509 family)
MLRRGLGGAGGGRDEGDGEGEGGETGAVQREGHMVCIGRRARVPDPSASFAPVTEPAAVLFDFAGTLFDDRGVMQPDRLVVHARRRGLALGDAEAARVIERTLAYIDAPEREAEKDGSDLSAYAHRTVWTGLMVAAGPYEPDLADALYACMNDADSWRPYPDTLPVLQALAAAGVPVGVLSNIGWDIRPAFRRVGADAAVRTFVLSFEQGVVKPDPEIFRLGCRQLATPCERVLLVGDNPATDGAAVHAGLPTFLLPAERDVRRPRGLTTVLRLLGL